MTRVEGSLYYSCPAMHVLHSVSILSVLSSLRSLAVSQSVFTRLSLSIICSLSLVHFRVYRSVRRHFLSSMN